jgi:hypothetical protein
MQEPNIANIELHLLNYRLKILSIKKESIHKLMHPLVKIGFTNKTKSSFFSFSETNDDYSIVVDVQGFDELSPFINESDQCTVSQSIWLPMYLCGEDLPDSMSISKIARYLMQPLADCKISILAISMYQCDYVIIQQRDYVRVINCLSAHIPKIFDESLSPENEIVFQKSKGKLVFNLPPAALSYSQESESFIINGSHIVDYDNGVDSVNNENNSSLVAAPNSTKIQRHNSENGSIKSQIKLPLIIPDIAEYCITGLYSLDAFFLIIPSLIEIMFFETEDYKHNEIFFNFTKKETDISIVMETRLLKKFPPGALLNIVNDYWKLIRIGQAPVGLEVFGVCSSISNPLELANIDEYYISSFHTGYCFIPSDKLETAKELFAKVKAKFVTSSRFSMSDLVDNNGHDEKAAIATNEGEEDYDEEDSDSEINELITDSNSMTNPNLNLENDQSQSSEFNYNTFIENDKSQSDSYGVEKDKEIEFTQSLTTKSYA